MCQSIYDALARVNLKLPVKMIGFLEMELLHILARRPFSWCSKPKPNTMTEQIERELCVLAKDTLTECVAPELQQLLQSCCLELLRLVKCETWPRSWLLWNLTYWKTTESPKYFTWLVVLVTSLDLSQYDRLTAAALSILVKVTKKFVVVSQHHCALSY